MNITILDGGIINPGDLQWKAITSLGETSIYESTDPQDPDDPGQIARRTAQADVVLVNKLRLDAAAVAQLDSSVRLVTVMATSSDNVDVQALTKRGIAVCNVTDFSSVDVAEHTMALMLNLMHRVCAHSLMVSVGEWSRSGAWSGWMNAPVCLDKKVLGLIGFGNVSRRVGRLASAFGMEVLACCKTPMNPPSYGSFSFVSLEALLKKADIISLHCPLTAETRELICAKTLAKMKDGAILINVSHGGLVNEQDCADALASGKLAAMGADVLSQEPPAEDDPLIKAPNVLITPHMAWTSVTARQRLISMTGEVVRRWLQGTPINLLNKVKPASDKPASAKSAPAKPAPEKPVSVKPASDKPAPAKPVSDKAASEKPATAKPAPAKSAPIKPASEKTASVKSAPAKSVQAKPGPASEV